MDIFRTVKFCRIHRSFVLNAYIRLNIPSGYTADIFIFRKECIFSNKFEFLFTSYLFLKPFLFLSTGKKKKAEMVNGKTGYFHSLLIS